MALFNFGLPTPGEVRQQANRRLFNTLGQYGGGPLGQANMGAAALGMGLGRLFGGQGAAEKQAQSWTDIQQNTLTQLGGAEAVKNDPNLLPTYVKQLTNNLAAGGHIDKAMQVAQAYQGMAPQETEVEVAKKDSQQKQINTLRTGIEKVTKDMKVIDSARTKIKRNATEGTATGDMGMVFGIMKLYDPNSTVREGEYATAKNAAGVPDRILNFYNNAKDGRLLSPEQRKKFLATAENLYEAQRESTDRSIDQYMQYADEDNISRERVLGKERYKKFTQRRSSSKNKSKTIKVDW
jgi:hypothetical protein